MASPSWAAATRGDRARCLPTLLLIALPMEHGRHIDLLPLFSDCFELNDILGPAHLF